MFREFPISPSLKGGKKKIGVYQKKKKKMLRAVVSEWRGEKKGKKKKGGVQEGGRGRGVGGLFRGNRKGNVEKKGFFVSREKKGKHRAAFAGRGGGGGGKKTQRVPKGKGRNEKGLDRAKAQGRGENHW